APGRDLSRERRQPGSGPGVRVPGGRTPGADRAEGRGLAGHDPGGAAQPGDRDLRPGATPAGSRSKPGKALGRGGPETRIRPGCGQSFSRVSPSPQILIVVEKSPGSHAMILMAMGMTLCPWYSGTALYRVIFPTAAR